MLTTVEKVIFLQEIDIFEFTSTEDLAHIAAITEELRFQSQATIIKEGEIGDGVYVVLEGKVRLHSGGEEIMIAGQKDSFGAWSLLDITTHVATATALEETRLLKIDKEDFVDLLPDHVTITRSIFRALVKKIRSLMTYQ